MARGWDERADMYSLALIAWELCAGSPPLAALPDAAAAAEFCGGARPGRGAAEEVPWAGLAGIVRRGWAADAGARCTAEEAVAVLLALIEEGDERATGCGGEACAVA